MAFNDALRLRVDDEAIKAVTVAVLASTTGSSSADPDLIGGRIIGHYGLASDPLGQAIASIEVQSDGSVDVVMASSDTGTVIVNVLKGKG